MLGKLTTAEWGVIVAAVSGIAIPVVLYLLKKKEKDPAHTDDPPAPIIEIGNIKGDIGAIGPGATGTIDKRTGIDGETALDKLAEVAVQKGRADEQIDNLKGQLAEAVERIKKLQAEGKRPDAAEALDQLHKSGDMAKLQQLLIEDRDTHRDALIQRNYEISAVAYLRGALDIALDAVNQILALDSQDPVALNRLGLIHRVQGRFNEAQAAYKMVLALGKTQKRSDWQAAALGNLGNIYQTRGELEKAEDMHKKALEIDTKMGNTEGMADDYGNLGNIYFTRGELEKAEKTHKKALEIDTKMSNRKGMASTYGNLGNIYRIRGELEKAEDMYKKSLAISEAAGMPGITANTYGNLGNIYKTRGELDKAEDLYKKSLATSESAGMLEITANQYANLGSLYKDSGDTKTARQYWQKALALYKQIGMPHEVKEVQGWLDKLDKGS